MSNATREYIAQLIIVASLRVLCSASAHLIEYPDVSGEKGVIQTEVGVTLDQCKRLCHVTAECVGVSVEWPLATPKEMTCVAHNNQRVLDDRTGSKYFAKCPTGMTYFPRSGRCYHVSPESLTWASAANKCSALHPQAHLLEIRSEADRLDFKKLQGETMLLGAERVEGGKVKDIVWHFSRVPFSPSTLAGSWKPNFPSMNFQSRSAHCLGIDSSDMTVLNVPCDTPGIAYNFICQY